MLLQLLVLSHPFYLIVFAICLLVKKQNIRDKYFVFMYPLKKESVISRLELLKTLNPAKYKLHHENIESVLVKYRRLNSSISNKLEYYFQSLYFNNFKDRFIAFKTAPVTLKIFILLIILTSNLIVSLYFYDILEFTEKFSFLQFYLFFSIILIFVTLLFVIIELFVLGLFLSFFSLFDTSGKIRRISVHLEEIIRSVKPGGRKTKIGLPDMDETEGFFYI